MPDALTALHLPRDDAPPQDHRGGQPEVSVAACRCSFNERSGTLFNVREYPMDMVLLVVLWRLRYKLSLRDLAEMSLERSCPFTNEAVPEGEERFTPLLPQRLRAKRGDKPGCSWHVDGIHTKVHGWT